MYDRCLRVYGCPQMIYSADGVAKSVCQYGSPNARVLRHRFNVEPFTGSGYMDWLVRLSVTDFVSLSA